MDAPAIEIRGVSKVFGSGKSRFVALDDVSVHMPNNKFFTLLGPSGCGKTTLLRLIAGFDWPSEGSILLNGQDIAALPPFRRPVNTVFQNYALFPHLTTSENVAFGLRMLGWPKGRIGERVAQMLKLTRLETLSERRIDQISGGQQQRVALARALAPQPKVLLLDEPLSALDAKLRKDMQAELKRLQHETGITFIFVTHDQEEALAMSDIIAVMSSGKVLQVATPRDIYNKPSERFVAEFIGEANFLGATIGEIANGIGKARLRSGSTISVGLPPEFTRAGEAIVVIRPEHARLVHGPGQLHGIVEGVVFLGTDTHVHVRLDDGAAFTLRHQNSRDGSFEVCQGSRVNIGVADGAARALVA